MAHFTVKASAVSAAAVAVSKNSGRVIDNVLIESAPNGLSVVGTDAYRMFWADDENGTCMNYDTVILPPLVFSQLKTTDDKIEIFIDGENCSATVTDKKGFARCIPFDLIHKDYPDWKKVIAGGLGTPGGTRVIDTDFLASWAKAAKLANKGVRKQLATNIYPGDGFKMMMLESGCLSGIIMPLHKQH